MEQTGDVGPHFLCETIVTNWLPLLLIRYSHLGGETEAWQRSWAVVTEAATVRFWRDFYREAKTVSVSTAAMRTGCTYRCARPH